MYWKWVITKIHKINLWCTTWDDFINQTHYKFTCLEQWSLCWTISQLMALDLLRWTTFASFQAHEDTKTTEDITGFTVCWAKLSIAKVESSAGHQIWQNDTISQLNLYRDCKQSSCSVIEKLKRKEEKHLTLRELQFTPKMATWQFSGLDICYNVACKAPRTPGGTTKLTQKYSHPSGGSQWGLRTSPATKKEWTKFPAVRIITPTPQVWSKCYKSTVVSFEPPVSSGGGFIYFPNVFCRALFLILWIFSLLCCFLRSFSCCRMLRSLS